MAHAAGVEQALLWLSHGVRETCGSQPAWKQMKADDNGLAQNACPSSSAFIYFQGAFFVTDLLSLQGHTSRTPCESHKSAWSTPAAAYFPDSMREPQQRLFYAGGVSHHKQWKIPGGIWSTAAPQSK
eukprot:gene13045-3817_t